MNGKIISTHEPKTSRPDDELCRTYLKTKSKNHKIKSLWDNIFTDFKMTSQANHMNKLLSVKKDYILQGFHLQRVYKRRRKEDGSVTSTISDLRLGRSVPS